MPAAGRRPGNATEEHEGAGQRPALPEHHALLQQALPEVAAQLQRFYGEPPKIETR
ncbi:hypothetical protein I5U54_20425 [Stenotrophomonas maltophilia]|nr:hypothetical protein [Stenotrophomonas maltophilia]